MANVIRVLKYVDQKSVDNSSTRDLEIGLERQVVGCNRSLGKEFPVSVIVNDQAGNAVLVYVTGPVDYDPAIWKRAGGEHWKNTYHAVQISKVVAGINTKGDQFTSRKEKQQIVNLLLKNLR